MWTAPAVGLQGNGPRYKTFLRFVPGWAGANSFKSQDSTISYRCLSEGVNGPICHLKQGHHLFHWKADLDQKSTDKEIRATVLNLQHVAPLLIPAMVTGFASHCWPQNRTSLIPTSNMVSGGRGGIPVSLLKSHPYRKFVFYQGSTVYKIEMPTIHIYKTEAIFKRMLLHAWQSIQMIFSSFWINLWASSITYIHRNVLLLFEQGHDVRKTANSKACAKWKEVGVRKDS